MSGFEFRHIIEIFKFFIASNSLIYLISEIIPPLENEWKSSFLGNETEIENNLGTIMIFRYAEKNYIVLIWLWSTP